MTKAELIDKIARSRDLPPDTTKKAIGQILDLAFGELSTYFVRARVTKSATPRFTFPGFGTFTKKKRSARRGVNPRTLEPIQIDASFTLDFKPSGELRESMNTGKRKKNKKRRPGKKKGTTRKPGRKSTAKRSRSRRKLTPREDMEQADLSLDEVFGEDLPESPMRRKRAGRHKKTGSR